MIVTTISMSMTEKPAASVHRAGIGGAIVHVPRRACQRAVRTAQPTTYDPGLVTLRARRDTVLSSQCQ
jgi:hypothetical protein